MDKTLLTQGGLSLLASMNPQYFAREYVMPILDLKGDNELQDRLDLDDLDKGYLTLVTGITNVLGVMLFPNNPELREGLDATTLAEMLTVFSAEGLTNYPNAAVLMTPTFFQTMQKVTYEEIMNRVSKEMGRGKFAGRILWTIKRICDNSNYEGSVNKAMFLLEEMNNNYPVEDEYMPTKRTNMRDAWKAFKPVAHLWAAAWHYNMMTSIMYEDFFKFLACSEHFRHFGITHTARPQKGLATILSTEETWAVPDGFPLPPVEVELRPLTDEEKAILQDYRAPKMI